MRPIYFTLGIVCIGLGYIGAVTPLMPSTVFFLIALWSFKRSSPRLEDWLLNKSFIGPTLTDWENDRSLTLRTKVVAILMVWLSIGSSVAILIVRHKALWVICLLPCIAITLTVYLWTRKTKIIEKSGT